ncbi:MAG TPA: hypothetical protein VFE27_11755 [Acidobacteriaceae bacterium]|nr:hypothetical protein [Acidobacteriaceae bacterium]
MTPTRLVLKAAFLYVAGFAFSMCTLPQGQTITGTWQGTLSAKESQRIVLKFAKGRQQWIAAWLPHLHRPGTIQSSTSFGHIRAAGLERDDCGHQLSRQAKRG